MKEESNNTHNVRLNTGNLDMVYLVHERENCLHICNPKGNPNTLMIISVLSQYNNLNNSSGHHHKDRHAVVRLMLKYTQNYNYQYLATKYNAITIFHIYQLLKWNYCSTRVHCTYPEQQRHYLPPYYFLYFSTLDPSFLPSMPHLKVYLFVLRNGYNS